MKSKLFKFLPLLLFSIAASGYAANAAQQCPAPAFEQGHPVQTGQMTSGYNAPARYDVEGAWDFYVTGSFIYWQARMDGLSLGNYVFAPPTEPGEILLPDFDYKPGFKVGLGMNSSFDNWNVYAEYTWIRDEMKTNHTVPATASATNAFWNTNADADGFNHVHSKWDHHNNVVDLNLGRSHYVGTRLTFMPFIGARAYWIGQDYDVTYTNTTVAPANVYFSHTEADSWAIGARTGVQTSWLLGNDFRLIGNVAGSLAYQKFKTHYHEYDETSTLTGNLKSDFGQITPNVEGAIGLGWGSYFSNQEWHLDFAALYEFHYFWNQNAMNDLLLSNIVVGGDLMYQGLTLTARLDF